jgi:hypothetical protein
VAADVFGGPFGVKPIAFGIKPIDCVLQRKTRVFLDLTPPSPIAT